MSKTKEKIFQAHGRMLFFIIKSQYKLLLVFFSLGNCIKCRIYVHLAQWFRIIRV